MNIAGVLALVMILFSPGTERDIHLGSKGEAVHIHAQLSRHYEGEPLRFTDDEGRKACFDETGEVTVRCVDQFYGSTIATSLKFATDGILTDTVQSIDHHPSVLPIAPVTRIVQTVKGQATAYRVFGYDEAGMSVQDAARFRQLQQPFWLRIREDIALNDHPIVSLYWYQTLNGIQLERIEPH
jgi:hypothetical protein